MEPEEILEGLLSDVRQAQSALQAAVVGHAQRCRYGLTHDHAMFRELLACQRLLQESHDGALVQLRASRRLLA